MFTRGLVLDPVRGVQDQDVLGEPRAQDHLQERARCVDAARVVGAAGLEGAVAAAAAEAAGGLAPGGVAVDGAVGGGRVAAAVEPRVLAREVEDRVHGGGGSPELERGVILIGGRIFLDGEHNRRGFGRGHGRGRDCGRGERGGQDEAEEEEEGNERS